MFVIYKSANRYQINIAIRFVWFFFFCLLQNIVKCVFFGLSALISQQSIKKCIQKEETKKNSCIWRFATPKTIPFDDNVSIYGHRVDIHSMHERISCIRLKIRWCLRERHKIIFSCVSRAKYSRWTKSHLKWYIRRPVCVCVCLFIARWWFTDDDGNKSMVRNK